MRRRSSGLCSLLAVPTVVAAAALAGCADPQVGVRLVFPSERSFLVTANARIDVYDGDGAGAQSPDAICRSLSVNPPAPPAGMTPIATTGLTDVCGFLAGAVRVDGIGVGRRVFFVETVDFDSRTIVRGCKVVDVGADPTAAADGDLVDVVDVQLATLPDFPSEPAGCASIDEKCKENVSCKPSA
jgi:hypothetical protein